MTSHPARVPEVIISFALREVFERVVEIFKHARSPTRTVPFSKLSSRNMLDESTRYEKKKEKKKLPVVKIHASRRGLLLMRKSVSCLSGCFATFRDTSVRDGDAREKTLKRRKIETIVVIAGSERGLDQTMVSRSSRKYANKYRFRATFAYRGDFAILT